MGNIKISIEEIKERLKPLFQDEHLQLLLIFGSLAHGKVHKKSDIDLAFLYDMPVNIIELTNKVIRLLHTDRVDVVDLKRANTLLQFAVIKKGKLMYEKAPGVFHEFCSLAFRRYIDTKKLREARAKAISYFLDAKGLS